MTLGLSRGMNEVTQREWSFLLLLWGLSDPRIAELCEMPRCFSIKLHSETQVSGRLGMSGGRSPRHAQNPLSGERRKTLSITHHALSPPPSHHHLYIISSHQLTTTFLSYYNVTKKTFCAEKWRKAMIYYYYYIIIYVCFCCVTNKLFLSLSLWNRDCTACCDSRPMRSYWAWCHQDVENDILRSTMCVVHAGQTL